MNSRAKWAKRKATYKALLHLTNTRSEEKTPSDLSGRGSLSRNKQPEQSEVEEKNPNNDCCSFSTLKLIFSIITDEQEACYSA